MCNVTINYFNNCSYVSVTLLVKTTIDDPIHISLLFTFFKINVCILDLSVYEYLGKGSHNEFSGCSLPSLLS